MFFNKSNLKSETTSLRKLNDNGIHFSKKFIQLIASFAGIPCDKEWILINKAYNNISFI